MTRHAHDPHQGPAAIDIITPVGRVEPYLVENLRSVAALAAACQAPVRHWLVSDGPVPGWINEQIRLADITHQAPSTPGSVQHEVIDAVRDPNSGEHVRQGPARTRNRGLRAGNAPVVMTLDSDDCYRVEEMADLYYGFNLANAPWAAGLMIDMTVDGVPTWHGPDIDLPNGWTDADCYRRHARERRTVPFHPCATIVTRDLIEKVGGWDESLTYVCGEDIALWARICREQPGWFRQEAVLNYRHHAASITNSEWVAPAESGWAQVIKILSDRLLDNPVPSTGSFTTDLSLARAGRAA